MNNFFTHYPKFFRSHESVVDVSYWDTVLDLFDNKKYKESIIGVLRYANPAILEKYGNNDQSHFQIPHGSVTVDLKIENNTVKVSAPFLGVPHENPIPLYRQASELNFSPLNLVNIILRDDKITFEHESPLELCDPYKLWDIFYDICIYADSYDDEFIEKFKAVRITEPKFIHHSQEKLDEMHQSIVSFINEAFQYIEYFDQKGWGYFAWDVIVSTLMKIDSFYSPQGYLRTEIEKEIDYLMKSKDPESQLISRGKSFLKRLLEWDKKKLQDDLYDIEIFISPRRRLDSKGVKDTMKSLYDRAKKEFEKQDYIASSLSCKYIFYYLLYYYNVDEKYTNNIYDSIKRASGKTWKDAAKTLWKTFDDIMNDKLIISSGKRESGKKKGFLASLFGN